MLKFIVLHFEHVINDIGQSSKWQILLFSYADITLFLYNKLSQLFGQLILLEVQFVF